MQKFVYGYCFPWWRSCGLTKTLLVMKLTILLLTAACLTVYASGVSQTITLSGKNVELKKVFTAIKKQTGYVVFYNHSDLNGTSPVTLSVYDVPLREFLDIMLKDQPLDYKIEDKTIMLYRKAVFENTVPVNTPLLDTAISLNGRVTGEQGEALEGVTVTSRPSGKTAVTNAQGFYTLVAGAKDRSLQFSFVGYATAEASIGSGSVINIELQKQVSRMEEVVVVGYGKQKRRDLTGAVASIRSDEITKTKVPSFQEAIQGKLPGVFISSSSGEPGSAMNISIRGSNSIYAGSNPLYVIDGVPYDANSNEMVTANIGNKTVSNPLSNLNPNDIETIDVLKDASATAIYGSRGANGVIIITTKTGKIGQPRITYDGYVGLAQATKKLNVLNAEEYLEYMKIVQPNSALFYYDTNKDGLFNNLDQPRDLDSLVRHDFQNEVLRTAFSHNHNISLSGNSNGTNYSAALGYLGQDAIVKGNDNNRFTFRLNLNRDFGKRLKIGLNANTSNNVFNGPSHSGGGAGLFNGVVQNILIARPVEFFDPLWDRTSVYVSPLSMFEQAYKSMSTSQNTVNGNLNYKIASGLSLNLSGGGIWTDSKGKEFYGKNTDWGVMDRGLGILQYSKSRYLYNTNQLVYEKAFNEKHYINAMAAMELGQFDFEYFNVSKSNFTNEETGIDDISKGATAKGSSSSRDISRRISYFGRLNYTFAGRHLLTATYRADGSDKFGRGNRFGFFPSFAYAWIASDEAFLKNSKTISNLKFRLSYGQTGNERIPSFRYLPRLSNRYYEGLLGFAPSSRENPNLKWENTTQYNMGIDLGLFRNRVNLTFDWYNKQTNDMLIDAYVAARTGYSRQWQNIGRVDNSGIEFQINSKNVDRENFTWETTLTVSGNKNVVKSIGNLDFIPVTVGGSWIVDVGRVVVGNQIGTGYGYKFDGVYQVDDFTWQNNSDPTIPHKDRTYSLKDGVVSLAGQNVKPGYFKFKDLNGDNVVDLDNDRTIISRSLPKFFGGFNNTLRYKNFDLNIFFEGSYGAQIMNVSKYQMEGAYAYTWMNISKDFYENRWTPEHPTNQYGDFNEANTNSRLTSDYYVEDASYLRLKNLSLGYSFNESLLQRLHIQNMRVYLSASNVYTWTRYSGFDPEIQSGESLMQGLDRISYPRARVFNLGINLTF